MSEQNEALILALRVLEVDESADLRALRTAFRKRSMETHPDQGGSADAFADVARAYETLVAHLPQTEDIELSDDGPEQGHTDDVDEASTPERTDGWVVDSEEIDVRVVDEDAPPRRKRFEDMFLDALRREYRDE